jgi:hypothetical protein
MALECKYRDVPNSGTHIIYLSTQDLPAAACDSPLINILRVYVVDLTFIGTFSKIIRYNIRDLRPVVKSVPDL